MTDKEKNPPGNFNTESFAYTTSSDATYSIPAVTDADSSVIYTVTDSAATTETPDVFQTSSYIVASNDISTSTNQNYEYTFKDIIIPVTSVNYRGYNIPIYLDEQAQQFYCYWENQKLEFGAYNMEYASDLESMIDRKLDVIYTFDEDSGYFGTRLEWFDNNGNRDIKLLYRGRILKVFLSLSSEPLILTDTVLKDLLTTSTLLLRKVVGK